RHGEGKWILKKAMEPLLPHHVIYRPKTGFGAPLRRWLHVEMKELLESDKAIVVLRANVTSTTSNQLALGTATTNDYLVAINAEDQARQNMLLHQIQLLMIGYHLKTITGN
ncbi:MAG TPA: asparagine synthase-related protein, partial [Saprospiraceae bacterium]|nr:asparagine synthase-related protein [Saprospiraceae bacterium]